jgi:ribosome-associated heat shock protein Hsp15
MGSGVFSDDSVDYGPAAVVKHTPDPISVSVRLDVWLDVACIFRTRSEAQQAIKGGKVYLNGYAAKPHKDVRPGDVLDITKPHGRRLRLVVRGLAEKHIPKAEARALYEDTTPPPTAEEQALLDLIKLAGPRRRPKDLGAPSRDERRRLRGDKERW